MTVGHLKRVVKNINENTFKNIDDRDLVLWKVNIPTKGENLVTKIYAENIEEQYQGVMLSPFETVGEYFHESTSNIRVIVQPPVTTAKRKAEGDEESGNQKKDKRTYPDESEEGRDSLMVISPERLKKIADFVKNKHICLLRSPPSSGKSTLGQVLRDYFESLNYDSVYISLVGINGKQAIYDEGLFENFWEEKVGRTWTEISKRKKATYVFIDEIQIIYGDRAPFFWSRVKDLLSSESNLQNIRLVLLGTYHPTLDPQMTPVEIHHTLGLNDLLLGWEEVRRLTENYVQLHATKGSDLFKVPEIIQRAIFDLTGGHPGLCRLILSTFRNRFRNFDEDTTVMNMLQYLASSELLNSITDCSRAFYWIHDWKPNEEEAEFIRNILLFSQIKVPFSVNYNSDPISKSFIKAGVFAMVDEKIQFTAPIMRIILSHRLFTSPIRSRSPVTSFDDFLLRTIERMSPSKLFKSLGKSAEPNSRLFERSWQMVWYRTATNVVPVEASISADVGPVFGSAGFLDFYVNKNFCWGIELTREGDRLKEHAQRFEGGDYADIPLKDWAIIDFRHRTKQVSELKRNFWYVLYEDNYEYVTIKRRDQGDKVLALHGDEV
ncbi:9009_t:CDS:2 [Ambispora leptoticha]|uniref:9009_t:CDS:1 n=1 Tax=Ambispora leptoticha TaxID=144679 RepID=A0A9N9BIG2_9GLOM|nr:9009_t:CDS:2 [Ambispora leptoticha]